MQLYGRHCFLLLIFFTGFLVQTANAQQLRYAFKNYTANDGLPSSEVHKVLQDARHYMWFATDHGVCRYNGYEFKTFNLADNSILGLYEDYKKRIWAWSFSGRLFVFENEKFEEYKWNEKIVNAIKPGVVNGLYLDTANVLFISASGPHSIKLLPDGKIYDLLKNEAKAIFEFIESNSSLLYGFTRSYPGKFNISGKRPNISTTLSFNLKDEKFSIEIPNLLLPERYKAVRLSENEILFHSPGLLINIQKKGSYTVRRTDYLIYEVKKINGKYYYGTDKGLMIEDENANKLAHYFNGIPIVSIEMDYEEGLWFTSTSKAVYYLNSSRITHLAKENVILDQKITALLSLKDSSVLAGTSSDKVIWYKLLSSWKEQQLFIQPVYSFYQDTASRIFVGGPFTDSVNWEKMAALTTKGSQFVRVPGMTNFIKRDNRLFIGLSDNLIEADLSRGSLRLVAKESFRASVLYLNRKEEILIGNILGLWKFVDGRLVRYDSAKKILKTRITDIAEYSKAILCLGTRGKGLLLSISDSVLELNEDNGLISNNVRKIFVDGQLIWVATNKGISIVEVTSRSPFKYRIRHVSVQDGLLSNEVNDITRSNNQIVVATNTGISYLERKYYSEKKKGSIAFYITQVKINGEAVNVAALTKAGFKRRNVAVSFEALKFNNQGKLSYRYRLEGYSNIWFYTSDLQLQLNPVPYGKYELVIQAKSDEEEWDDTASVIRIPITCNPPFWSTIVFWVFAFTIILTGLFFAFYKRVKVIRQRQDERNVLQQRINETEQLALKSQMNPHFIFNSLNSIQQYVIDRDVKGANSFISGFSKLMRQTLDFSSKEKITLAEEIGYLKNYLELERMRMESKFDFSITVDAALPATELRLPPLMLQPYVENALRHGVRYLKDKSGHILLSFKERNGVLECNVEDNGIGRDKAGKLKAINPIEYQSKGMSLTAERAELLNRNANRKIVILVTDLTNEQGEVCGTKVSVKFPV